MNFLEGENIYLRPLCESDIDGKYRNWLNDSEVCGGNSHCRFPVTPNHLREYINSIEKNQNNLILAIIWKKNNQHIGNVSIQNINYISRMGEFAILIGEKDYWNKKCGKEAMALVINHSFKNLNLNRIYCGTYENNIGMRKLAENMGFKQEGIRRQADFKEGKFIDVIEYGLLKSEWENKEESVL